MYKEQLATPEQQPVQNTMELSLNSPEQLAELKTWLEPIIGTEGAEQLIFVLQAMEAEDYTNQCDKAVSALGKKLNTRFGEEESFFETVPGADYYDASSQKPLTNIGYIGQHHTVGLLELKSDQDTASLVIDLTYGEITKGKRQDTTLVIKIDGAKRAAMEKLNSHYGGAWEIGSKLDIEKGHMVFQENG